MKRALAVNGALAVAAALAGATLLPGEIRMLGAAAFVLVLPGLAWLGAFRGVTMTPARLALVVAGLSCASAAAGVAAGAPFAPPPHLLPFLVWTFAVSNLGLALTGPWPALDRASRWPLLAAVAATAFLITAMAALHLVPPLEDHDMEVRGTAYGLVSDGKPYFTSNREVFLPMSHPVLFNVVVAQSLVVTREIEAVRPSYDSSKRAEAAAARGEPFDWDGAWQADYREFLARPALAGTRAPSAFFAALIAALLADLLLRLTGSAAAAALGVAVYALVPETIVRNAYAGYFGETIFAMLVATALLADDGPGASAWVAAAGALMAMLDHKTVVFVVALAGFAALVSVIQRARPDGRVVALVGGFGAGTLVWWAYGFWVSPRVFIDDHLRKHLVHRFLLNDVRLVPDHVNHYAPSIPELWREFAAHTGWVLVPLAIVAAAWALLHRSRPLLTTAALWFLGGAVAFSLTDWRQTKHLMNGLAPMVLLALAVPWPDRRARRIALALLAIALALCLVADVRLVGDFHSLHVSGASDIDGW